MPARIEVTEIAGVEPAVAQDRRRRVGTIPVSLHDYRPAESHFTDRWTALFLRLRVDDFPFDVFHRFAHRANYIVVRRVDENCSRSFRKAVSLQDIDTEIAKILRDSRIE